MSNKHMDTLSEQEVAVVDLGPLAWVVDTLRETLQQADADLSQFSTQVADASGKHITTLDTAPLRQASQGLHEAVGVLDMVEQPSAARVVSAMEAAVQRFVANPELTSPEAVAVLREAGAAVIDYLASVLRGNADLAPGLFPRYLPVAEMAGLERIHPADLWRYEWRWQDIDISAVPQEDAAAGSALQTLFLRSALMSFKTDGKEGLPELAVAALGIARSATDRHARIFWLLFTALVQALSAGVLHFDVHVKRLMSRVISHFSAWQSGQDTSLISDRSALDMLYFAALGAARLPEAQRAPVAVAVSRAYALDRVPVAGYEQALYGVLSREQNEKVQSQIAAFKGLWSDVASGDARKLPRLHEEAGPLLESTYSLWPDSVILCKAIWRVIDALQQSGMPPNADLGMEMATAILFLEASLANYQPADIRVSERSRELAQRLLTILAGHSVPDLTDWMRALYMSVNEGDTMRQVVVESRSALGEIEQELDLFFRAPQELVHASNALPKLETMGSALSMLGYDSASRAVSAMRTQVQQLMAVAANQAQWSTPATQAVVEKVAGSLGTLSFLLEMLEYQPAQVEQQFYFDEKSQELFHRTPDRFASASQGAERLQGDSQAMQEHAVTAKGGDVSPQEAAISPEAGMGVMAPVSPVAAVSSPSPVMPEQIAVETVSVAAPVASVQSGEEVFAQLAAVPSPEQVVARPADSVPTTVVSSTAMEQPVVADVVFQTEPEPVQEEAVASMPQASVSELDDGIVDELPQEDDLREIFLEEATEVIANGQAAVKALEANHQDQAQLTNLRRAFHTLKGSGRMVGLCSFGEAAWELERTFNGWLAESAPATPALLDLARDALQALGQWRDAIEQGEQTDWHHSDFRRSAAVMQQNKQYEPLQKKARAGQQPVSAPTVEMDDGIVVDGGQSVVEPEPEDPGVQIEVDQPSLVAVAEAGTAPVSEAELQTSAVLPDPALHAGHTGDAIVMQADLSLLAADSVLAQTSGVAVPADDLAFDLAGLDVASDNARTEDLLDAAIPVPALDSKEAAAVLADWNVLAGGGDSAALSAPEKLQDLHQTAAVQDKVPVLSVSGAAVDSAVTAASSSALASLESGADDVAGGRQAAVVPEDALGDEIRALDMATRALFSALSGVVADDAPTPSTATLATILVDTTAQQEWLAGFAADLQDSDVKVVGGLHMPISLFNTYLDEANGWSRQLQKEVGTWQQEHETSVPDTVGRLAHSLAGSSASVGLSGVASLSRGVEHAVLHLQQRQARPDEVVVLVEAAEMIQQDLQHFAAGVAQPVHMGMLRRLAAIIDDEAQPSLLEEKASEPDSVAVMSHDTQYAHMQVETEAAVAAAVQQQSAASSTPAVTADSSVQIQDAIDPDLFDIFRAEGDELLPQISAAMRQWTAQVNEQAARDELLRLLHTLKGGARLAGAMRLGSIAHDIETEIGELGTRLESAEQLEAVQTHLDDMEREYARVSQLDHREVSEPAIEAGTATSSSAATLQPLVGSSATPSVAAQQQGGHHPAATPVPDAPRQNMVAMPVPTDLNVQKTAPHQQVRVRAQLLDRLLGQAGEVMTSRARLEGELGQLRSALKDMDSSLDRLRTQLREMELQAETQMQSRLALSKEHKQNFDPLEFDRFTRVQELTRMMAESVNDVASVQRNILRTVQSTEDDLSAQARQTKDLQDDLLRTRTIEFDSLSERLYRVVRQSAKETGKQVKLDIVGANIEMDRSIIERIAPVFEHLLRNAVVHGVEDSDQRARVGKGPVGNIHISLHPEGNDVLIRLKDDGAGLNVLRIRDKAIAKGLLEADSRISDEQAAQLIFSSGLSTAESVTSLAGRGVGMDVVRNEINALGGRIEVSSRQHLGTEFTLVLPLTTAVTQVVELRMGSYHIGVPSHMIDSVRRATAKDIQAAYNSRSFAVDGENLPFYWGGAMLQFSRRSEETAAKRQVVVVLRSAAQRIVLHVDEVIGAHEVVVKNLGPQLARVPALAGITVLPDGRMLYIYNPVALSYVYGALIQEFSADPADPGVLEQGGGKPAVQAAAKPDVPPLVLVVDDSITVRRVTERLLKREGYRVALAADGLAALQALAQERPGIVLSDIEMPQMDGFDLLRNIRLDDAFKDLPIIMITSRTADKHRDHAMQLGATGFLGKPYPEDELLALIRQYAGEARR